jgi:hypothetical protein
VLGLVLWLGPFSSSFDFAMTAAAAPLEKPPLMTAALAS